jgi:hypothetical protein
VHLYLADNGIANLSKTAAANPAPDEVLRWFDELRDPLRRYLMCAGADRADADEAVQEAFLRLYLQFQKKPVLTSITGHSRVKLTTTVRIRRPRPVAIASQTKSSAHS